jgi:DHA3 family macrolide efflux protein-like MFS transporter
MTQKTRPTGMLAFTIVWIGQVVSLLGSAMTWFAFTIWAWQTTGEATVLALVGFFSFGPTLLLSPIAGVLVDRWNRKLVMMVSDLASGLATIVVLSLYATGNLQVWHLYLVGAVAAAFVSFQFPAYSAAVTVMLPKEQYARAQGMMGLASSASGIFGPLLAALLLGVIGIVGIMMIDVATFLVAIGALLLVHIPQPVVTEAGREGHGSIWKESVYGFRYILERPSLLALQLVLAGSNLVHTLGFTLVAPMILARTGNEEIVLGSVQSAGAIGATIGGLLLVISGGPKRRIHGVLIGWTLASLMGGPLMGLGHNLTLWVLASFFSSFFAPIIYGSDQAIWQAKVAPDVQGRVFATRQLISQVTIPIAMLLAGPLADRVLEPAMRPEGNLSGTFGWLVGAGPGTGMALLIVFAGILGMLVGLGGYTFYSVRNAEDILPDYDGEVALPLEAYA